MKFIKKLKATVTIVPLVFAHCVGSVLSYDYFICKSTNQDLKCDKCGEKLASMPCGNNDNYFIFFTCDDGLNLDFCSTCYMKDYGVQMKRLIKKFVPEFNELKIWSLINDCNFIEQIPIVKNLFPDSCTNFGKRNVAFFIIKAFISKVIENGIDKYDEFVNN